MGLDVNVKAADEITFTTRCVCRHPMSPAPIIATI
jgi:hypothetical protein